jgi:hypothetical protein
LEGYARDALDLVRRRGLLLLAALLGLVRLVAALLVFLVLILVLVVAVGICALLRLLLPLALLLLLLRARAVVLGAGEGLGWRSGSGEDELLLPAWSQARAVMRGNRRVREDQREEVSHMVMPRLEDRVLEHKAGVSFAEDANSWPKRALC